MNNSFSPLRKRAGSILLTPILTLALILCFTASVFAQSYSGPLVITKGGTYQGNWESRNTEVPAVEIRTSQPVIIENSNIRGAGYLIKSWGYSTNLTVRHTSGYGLSPTPYRDYKKPRRFLTIDNFQNVVVENCYMESTAGIYIGTRYEGDGSKNETIRIRYNIAKNIDGRVYGGDKDHSQFVQFNFKGSIRHAEIAWNEVTNEADKSLVEDNINIHNSRGTSDSPIRIHNNLIYGAFPIPATSSKFSGGGIIADGDGDKNTCSAYIDAYENHLVGLGNYSMGIASGNNIRYHHNRSVNAAIFNNGNQYGMNTSGMWSKDYNRKGSTFDNTVDNNVIGVMAWGPDRYYYRNDISVAENADFRNNTLLPSPISKRTEQDELSRWQQKLQQNGIKLGPNGSVQEAPAPQAPVAETGKTGSGKISREVWNNIYGRDVSDIPLTKAPERRSELSSFETPTNESDFYGQRIRGYVTAPSSGEYTFWIAADDHSELWLSTSENPGNKVKIAYTDDDTYPQEWNALSSQKSAKIRLEAGKRYYIEALHKEHAGGDHLAVGWQLPSGAMERPIAGNRLSPFNESSAPESGELVSFSGNTTSGKLQHEIWYGVHSHNVKDIPVSKAPNKTSQLALFEAPSNVGDNYGQRIRG
ncbi:PA14 domain-containing protein, partial [Pontibacter sp. CAU 1760]